LDRVFFHETIRLDARSGNVNFFDFEFLIFFVVLLAIFWGLSSRPMAQQWVLLLGSALFLLSWNWTSLVVILANAAAVYWYSRWLKKNQSTLSLWIGIVAQLLVIVYFRTFINDQTTAYKANRFQLEVIIGLSFFALQNIGYLVQVWKRNIPPATRIQDYLLYNLYFPKVVVGPIVEYSDFEQSVKNSSAAIFSKNFYFSVFSIFLGLFKITVISQFIETTLSSLEMAYPDRILPGLGCMGDCHFWLLQYVL
jgi:alginate O-acetyltransferase complex protein AlgI